MPIIFRMPYDKELEIIANELAYWLDERERVKIFNEFIFIIGEGKWKEVFITTNENASLILENTMISPYTIGLTIGEIKNDYLLISLSGGQLIAKKSEKKVIINQTAEQLFLYSRDIHSSSILSVDKTLQIGDKVLVMNEDDEFLGIGKIELLMNDLAKNENKDKTAIKNLIDLGWYLRKGK
ncbi:MAG: hypothetical protein FK734_14005 [Asgard group archaeon]|nr:hypothetical protein [Asgard group archaeon]